MPSIQVIEVGDQVELEGRFANAAGTATNPSVTSLTITAPDGTVTTILQAALVNPSTGVWTYLLTPNQQGVWQYRFTGTGAVVGGETGYLTVDTGPRSTLCSAWCSVADLDECHSADLTNVDEGMKQRAVAAASDLLWRWTGYQYGGLCHDVVRPMAQTTWVEGSGRASHSQTRLGPYYESSWGYCACQAEAHGGDCGCLGMNSITLGRAPLRGIVRVRVDGATLAPTAYQIVDKARLMRKDGLSFPCCQDLTRNPASQTNTFDVEFIWGREAPPPGVMAAVDLAAELARACAGGDCALPANIATLARQDTTLQFIRPAEFGRDSNGYPKTGVRTADLFLSSYPLAGRTPGLLVSPESLEKDTRIVG